MRLLALTAIAVAVVAATSLVAVEANPALVRRAPLPDCPMDDFWYIRDIPNNPPCCTWDTILQMEHCWFPDDFEIDPHTRRRRPKLKTPGTPPRRRNPNPPPKPPNPPPRPRPPRRPKA